MFAFFAKKPAVPMISQAEHVRIVAEKVGEARKDLIAERDQFRNQAAGLRIQNDTHVELGRAAERRMQGLVAERDGLLRDKLSESERANLAEQRVNDLLDQNKALKPDAEKYRERCRRDREHAANKRKRAA